MSPEIISPTQNVNDAPPWGTYSPQGINKLLLFTVRLGLGRGKLKKLIQYLWNSSSNNSVVDINYHNILLRCSLQTNNIERKILFSSKLREKKEINLLKPYLKNGGTFVDIGANVGYYSLMAAQMGAKKVLSFEPNRAALSRFEFNVNVNGFNHIIDALPIALGAKRHEATMTASPDDLGAGTLVKNCVVGETFTVSVERIDEVLFERGIKKIDALKIDVEGYEDEALIPLLDCPIETMPKFIIIEHGHSDLWGENIINLLLGKNYILSGKTRSNTFLKQM